MKVKRRHLTLIEVLISLFLTGIIITMLFSYFSKIIKIDAKIENVKKDVYKKENVQIRLNTVFSQITPKKIFEENPFYTTHNKNSPVLHCTFDNGVDIDPLFSGPVLAKIYIKNNNLMLTYYPLKKRKANAIQREEILLENVKNYELKFLAKKDDNIKNIKTEHAADGLKWYFSWPKEKNDLPFAVLITLNKDLKFVFFMPKKLDFIDYKNKKI